VQRGVRQARDSQIKVLPFDHSNDVRQFVLVDELFQVELLVGPRHRGEHGGHVEDSHLEKFLLKHFFKHLSIDLSWVNFFLDHFSRSTFNCSRIFVLLFVICPDSFLIVPESSSSSILSSIVPEF
jgi:hypothetical protein